VMPPVHELLMNRRLLSDQVYDVLLRRVVHGELQPGARINVDAIADELEVSRTPVREAVTKLSWMRFVTVERNSRTFVAAWTSEDMRDRLLVVGKLSVLMLADPALALPTLKLPDESSTDVSSYLTVLEVLVDHSTNRVAAHAVSDQIAPLRMFLERHASTSCASCEASRLERKDRLRALRAACVADDRAAAVTALDCFTQLLAAAL